MFALKFSWYRNILPATYYTKPQEAIFYALSLLWVGYNNNFIKLMFLFIIDFALIFYITWGRYFVYLWVSLLPSFFYVLSHGMTFILIYQNCGADFFWHADYIYWNNTYWHKLFHWMSILGNLSSVTDKFNSAWLTLCIQLSMNRTWAQ